MTFTVMVCRFLNTDEFHLERRVLQEHCNKYLTLIIVLSSYDFRQCPTRKVLIGWFHRTKEAMGMTELYKQNQISLLETVFLIYQFVAQLELEAGIPSIFYKLI